MLYFYIFIIIIQSNIYLVSDLFIKLYYLVINTKIGNKYQFNIYLYIFK